MPPKKNKRKRLLVKKELKVIETRLLKISLKIENYIYKNQPISSQDAEIYIQEISSYKWQCRGNPRISQVTEKLLRQLKAVIEEGGSTTSYNVQAVIENSIPLCATSPTYSLQEIEMVEERDPLSNDTHENVKDDLEKISNRKEKDKAIKIVDHNDDFIDLCSNHIHENNEMVTDKQTTPCSSVQNIERSLSQLAIKSTKESKPSKLRKVRKISQYQESKSNNETLLPKYLHVPQICPHKVNNQDQNLIVANEINLEKSTNKVVLTDSTASLNKPDKMSQNLPKKKPRKKAAQRNELNNKTRKNKQINDDETQHSNETAVNKKQIKTVCPSNPPNINTLIKPTALQTINDPIKKVYNNNVENDLSWIENIRYIREVAPEEIDPKLKYYDDSFWDTFDLPSNWNDQDFLY